MAVVRRTLADHLKRIDQPTIQRVVPWVALAAIVAIALLVRLYLLAELTPYFGDQGRDSLVVEGMVRNGQVPLLGSVSSTGTFHRGPAAYYLMAPGFLVMGGDPTGGAMIIVLADVLTVILLAVLGRQIAGWPAGLVAAGLWATNAFTAQFGRMMWNPELLPPFEMLVFLAMIGLSRGKPRWFMVLLPAWTLAWQMHDQALLLLPMMGLWWIVVRPRVTLKIIVAAIGLALLVALPFVAYELMHGFPNLQAMVAQAFGHGGAYKPPSPLDRLGTVVSMAGTLFSGRTGLLFWGAALGGMAWILNRLRRPERAGRLIVVLLAATSLIYAVWPGSTENYYYYYILVPVPFLLIGIALSAVCSAGSRYRPVAVGLGAFLGVAIVVSAAFFLVKLHNQPTNPRALGSMKEQIAAIDREAGGKSYAVRLVSGWDAYQEWDVPYRYLLDLYHGPSPGRVDLPTFVIYDSPDPGKAGGELLAGARIVGYPAPTVGPELLAGGSFSALDGGQAGGSAAAGTAAPSTVSQSVTVPGAGRYLLRFDCRCALTTGACRVSTEARDGSGAVLVTVATPATPSVFGSPSGSDWSTGSLYVDAPSGTVLIVVSVEGAAGAASYRNVSLRAVTSPQIPGAAVR
jgi:Dolichyl-phosphate-mannose-protein mannosyltransferase